MREARFDAEAPFVSQALRAAAVICRTEHGNLHAGVLHFASSGQAAVLNLAWQDNLRYEWSWPKLWAAPDVEPEILVSVAGMCRLIWDEFTKTREFPYGLRFSNTSFDTAGRLKLGPGARGLTCATFVLAVFDSVGVRLVDESDWPVRSDDDREYLKFVGSFATPEHFQLLQREVEDGCKRIQPQEVVGACLCSLPAKFQPSAQAGERALQKLAIAPLPQPVRTVSPSVDTQALPPGARGVPSKDGSVEPTLVQGTDARGVDRE